jgi:hypothetical protein
MNNENYNQETENIQQKDKIQNHIALSQEERQKHLDLTTECEFYYFTNVWGSRQIGDLYSNRAQRREAKQRLLDFHNIEKFGGYDIHVCHKCENDSSAEKICVSPLHTYFGTISENQMDKPEKTRKETSSKGTKSQMKNGTHNTQVIYTCQCGKKTIGIFGHIAHVKSCKNKP